MPEDFEIIFDIMLPYGVWHGCLPLISGENCFNLKSLTKEE